MRVTVITILILFSTFTTKAQYPTGLEMTRDQVQPGQFDYLKEELKDVDIVLLGEPYHGPVFYPTKIQLVKYLHEQLGFDVLAFESGLFQMDVVNRDIRNGDDVALAFQQGLFPIWTSTDEFQELYIYIDSLRQAGSFLTIAGFDCQISARNSSQRFVVELKQACKRVNITPAESTLRILQAQFENLETGKKGLTDDFSQESLDALIGLARLIEPAEPLSLLHQALTGFIGHFSDLYHNDLLNKLRSGTYDWTDNNVRDSLMASHMLYLYRKLYPGKKIMAWGATGHFANLIQNLQADHPPKNYRPMGYHLKRELGSKVYSLTVTTDLVIPNTLEWELGKLDLEQVWLSSQSLGNFEFSSACLSEVIGTGKWSEVVDGMLYFDSKPIPTKSISGNIKGKIIDAKTKSPISFATISIPGTTIGTVSEMDGTFELKVDSIHLNKAVRISCIGYSSRLMRLDNFLKSGRPVTVNLLPQTSLLQEVVIEGRAPDAKEIIEEVVRRMPTNYPQTPFMLEFYSRWEMSDTVAGKDYLLETVFEVFNQGYFLESQRSYRVTQKRETGKYPSTAEKTHGLAQWPMVEVAFLDIYTKEAEIHNLIWKPEQHPKINAKFQGVKVLDHDTVFLITYDYRAHGEIFVSTRDYAVLRYTNEYIGRNFRNKQEIRYKKINDLYYLHSAKGEYWHPYTVNRKKRLIKMSNTSTLSQSIKGVDNVPQQDYELWAPKHIPYNKNYWETHFPLDNK